MPQYLLLLHEDPADARALSPEEMQRVIEKYVAWSDGLQAGGRLQLGLKLRDEGGRQLRGDGAGAPRVTDGPYAEGKELVAGLFVIEAADYDDAVAVARGCPHVAHGWIEVREVEPT